MLKPSKNVKLVIFVPETHGDLVRSALHEAGCGCIGNYVGCSFTSKGVGRFQALKGARPAIGAVGISEAVIEERIEVLCPIESIERALVAVKAVHPYEEIAYDIYNVLEIKKHL